MKERKVARLLEAASVTPLENASTKEGVSMDDSVAASFIWKRER